MRAAQAASLAAKRVSNESVPSSSTSHPSSSSDADPGLKRSTRGSARAPGTSRDRRLGLPDVRLGEENLPGKVGPLHPVRIDEEQAHPGHLFGERKRGGASQAAHSQDDRGAHTARSRLNSRSPAEVISASPLSSLATAAAAAAACEARSLLLWASSARARAA